jgi:hypothetical protein
LGLKAHTQKLATPLPLKKSQTFALEKPDLKSFSDCGKKISMQKPFFISHNFSLGPKEA